jgi:hypothetical protein
MMKVNFIRYVYNVHSGFKYFIVGAAKDYNNRKLIK